MSVDEQLIQGIEESTMQQIEDLWDLGYIYAAYPIEYTTSSEGSSDAFVELLMDDLEPILDAMGCKDHEKEIIRGIEDSDELIQHLCDIDKGGLLIEFRGQKYKKDGKNSWRRTCVRFSYFIYAHDWGDVGKELIAAIPEIQKIVYQEAHS